MSSPIGGKKNVKIFVLYLMENINYPLDFTTLNDIVMQTDYVMYLDFAEAFHEMLDLGLILEMEDEGEKFYCVSQKGRCVAQELHSDIISSILDRSLAAALRYLDFKRRGITVDCTYEKLSDQTVNVTFFIRERDKLLMQTTINVDSDYRSEKMRRNFYERPDVIYRGVVALLSGNVNYLFDK